MLATRQLSTILNRRLGRFFSPEFFVLGIETSCDDTGVSVVSSEGRVLSDERHSQLQTHLLYGGVVPDIAGRLHQENIKAVTKRALDNAGIPPSDIQSIAVTQGPGLALSLQVGIDHAFELSKVLRKPVIPVHHMEAHALTVRLSSPVTYPFLVLLASGGHCILAVCEGIGQFYRLGECLDDSPGEAFDKVSRMLRLDRHSLGRGLCGGAAIEAVAGLGDPQAYPFRGIMTAKLNCNFSFAGIKTSVKKIVDQLDSVLSQNSNPAEDSFQSPVPGCENIAASFQKVVCSHLTNRTERAIIYCRKHWPAISQLVVSGGVASNRHLRNELDSIVERHGYNLFVPPPSLCTDNGIMIAWAGVEHIKAGLPYVDESVETLYYHPRWKLGKDISANVSNERIKVNKKYLRSISVL